MINTSPTIYNKVNSTVKAKQDLTVMSQLRLLKLALLLLTLISTASLVIIVYVVIAFGEGKWRSCNLSKEIRHRNPLNIFFSHTTSCNSSKVSTLSSKVVQSWPLAHFEASSWGLSFFRCSKPFVNLRVTNLY